MTRECAGAHPDRDHQAEDTPNQVTHPGDPVWCEEHRWQIRDHLTELPELYAAMHLEATHGTAKPSADKVSGTRTHPSPSPRIDDADQLARWACDWEDTIRHELGHPAAPHTATGRPRALTEATRYLLVHLTKALELDDGGSEPVALIFGTEVNRTHRTLLRKTSRDTLIHRLKAPCPACDIRALQRRDGEDHIRCTHCHTLWTEVEYQRLVLILTSSAG